MGQGTENPYSQEGNGMKFWIIQYYHRYGVDAWPEFSEHEPTEKQIIKTLSDWEGKEKEERIEISGPYQTPGPAVALPIGCAARYKEIHRIAASLSETFVNGNKKDLLQGLVKLGPTASLAVLSIMMMRDQELREGVARFLKEMA